MNAERDRRFFEYECNSDAKVLASLDAVPAELRAEPFQKAVNLVEFNECVGKCDATFLLGPRASRPPGGMALPGA